MMIYYFGTFEPHCLSYLKRCVRKGGTIVDVGANIGLFTLESSFVVGKAGRVVSIEAAPSHVEALKHNIELNFIKNVSVIETAVGDKTGHATLTRPRGGNLGTFTVGAVDGNETYVVPVRPMDQLLGEMDVSSLDLIKIDIEGSEFCALRGAKQILREHRPTLLIELNEAALRRCNSSTQDVKELLGEHGYRGWRIGQKTVREILDHQVTHGCDECLFVHRTNNLLMERLQLI
jgi:FkbM family methyltransferase